MDEPDGIMDGRNDGFKDGKDEGNVVGFKDGRADGNLVGTTLGPADGRADGLADGIALGRTLGRPEGRDDGAIVGKTNVGRLIGSSAGVGGLGDGGLSKLRKKSPLTVALLPVAAGASVGVGTTGVEASSWACKGKLRGPWRISLISSVASSDKVASPDKLLVVVEPSSSTLAAALAAASRNNGKANNNIGNPFRYILSGLFEQPPRKSKKGLCPLHGRRNGDPFCIVDVFVMESSHNRLFMVMIGITCTHYQSGEVGNSRGNAHHHHLDEAHVRSNFLRGGCGHRLPHAPAGAPFGATAQW
jgi:hypothetical protein